MTIMSKGPAVNLAGPSQNTEEELLEQLLREGLTTADPYSTSSGAELARYHKLLDVLISACINLPLERGTDYPPTKIERERVTLTLSILARQIEVRPELLVSLPAIPLVQVPLYHSIITRLLYGAFYYDHVLGGDPIVAALCEAVVGVLVHLDRELSEGESTFMRGNLRTAHTVQVLCDYATGGLEGKTISIGYPDLPTTSECVGPLLVLQIIFKTSSPFIAELKLSAAIALAEYGPQVKKLSPRGQTRYVNTVVSAVKTNSLYSVLSPACVAVIQLPSIDNDEWQEAVSDLLCAVEACDDDALKRDVWRSIYERIQTLSLNTTSAGSQMINFLLSPPQPHLNPELLRALIPVDILRRWAEESVGMDDVRDKLKVYIAVPAPTSLKRKRRDNPAEERVSALLRTKVPELKIEGDVLNSIPRAIEQLGPVVAFKLLETTPSLACALAQCEEDHKLFSSHFVNPWFSRWAEVTDQRTLMRALGVIWIHTGDVSESFEGSPWTGPLGRAYIALRSSDRQTRIAAANLISAVYLSLSKSKFAHMSVRVRQEMVTKNASLFIGSNNGYPVRETAIILLGDLGRNANDAELGDILEILLKQLGSPSSPLASLAYTQLVGIANYRNKQPYNLLSPYLDRISVLLAESLVPQPDVVAETMQFIGYTRQAFFTLEAARKAVIPALVVRQNRPAIEMLATIFGQKLGFILVDEGAAILAKIFLSPQFTDSALRFVGSLLNELINNSSAPSSTLDKYIRASIVPLVVTIVIELGDEDKKVQGVAARALDAVQRATSGTGTEIADLGVFLKPHMLGVLATMSEQLMTPRTPTDNRRKIIRSIGKLISLVGDSMASFSPQIVASLQSTLEVPELQLQTLQTWYTFIELLRFADVGPFIGQTIAAIVAGWSSFEPAEREVAKLIVTHISDNASHLVAFRDDIVRFEHIPELWKPCLTLMSYRNKWSIKEYLANIVERTDNKNVVISTASMRELRNLLHEKHSDILQLARGDTFDPIVGRVVRSLLAAVTRDGDCEDLRDLSYECFGILGALDPDRFMAVPEETSMTIKSNFSDHDESINFALHLIRDLLVGAFRSTNDTRHQKNLSYAIQELLKFCGFDSRLVNRQHTVSNKTRQKWDQLPKDVLETVTPLLDAQFKQNQAKTTKFDYPIYPRMKTYREWVQAWTVDLIGRVMELSPTPPHGDAQIIFGVFNSEPKNQDVAVAHHILPHLVLHVLLSGDQAIRDQIKLEIDDVLRDQVSPTAESAADKRMLSAQVIFDLMDHLSTWLRLSRDERADQRDSHTRPVDQLISGIDTELAANAALKSKAYARSLRNFEQRVVYLRTHEKRGNAELQTYFESLHEIYAELDEPDGMEGVSAFVISPTLDLQIREHESTGHWTSALSCWEVRLQQSPEDVKQCVGLLRCLKNLGHYNTLRTHIREILNRHPEWARELAPFEAEAAWTIGDWATVRQVANPPPIANAFLAVQSRATDISEAMRVARRQIGAGITTRQYSRAYESILQLHMLREVEMIDNADSAVLDPGDNLVPVNRIAIMRHHADALVAGLAQRFETVLPSFHAREEILSKRRTAFSLVRSTRLRPELGQAWIQSAKIARKAGYDQTAFTAALQAHELDTPFAFIQQAKIIRGQGGILKALRELDTPVVKLLHQSDNSPGVIDLTDGVPREVPKTEEDFRMDRSLAKAVLLEARWSYEAARFEQNDVIRRFKKATELGHTLESPYFHLGHYYDSLARSASNIDEIAAYNYFTCLNYHEALQRGVKYIYQTMPRLLTIWLDLGEHKELKRSAVAHNVDLITKLMEKSKNRIMMYEFLTAFPQMISRITHPNAAVREALARLVYRVIREHAAQALWPTIGAMQSKRKDRRDYTDLVLRRALNSVTNGPLVTQIADARKLSTALLRLAEDKPESKVREVSIAAKYSYVKSSFPSSMILPLQDALTSILPAPGTLLRGHQAFPELPVTIVDINDKVEIMPSLQQPKKLVFLGSDGKRYPFLCKPHDDLRKDARLMDFNSMINKFLKSASESRRRHLYIRTYAVMPLNEECGLIEWVSNTNALKSILEAGYGRHKKLVYTKEVYSALEAARKGDNMLVQVPNVFRNKILPMYSPSVFHEWFLTNWPEPTAWLTSRTNYARTLAVMSMIGYVLGLGDRHGENILFDGLTGDTVHVDLNCLFDKAKTFDVPERVPFRLTHNMVDALGVTGVEGAFRKAAEITMGILRSNSDSLMSVLEAFVHDPLVEWTKSSRSRADRGDVRGTADKNLKPIEMKLRGVTGDIVATVPNQVEALIQQATSTTNLGLMYIGWAAWL